MDIGAPRIEGTQEMTEIVSGFFILLIGTVGMVLIARCVDALIEDIKELE